MADCWLDRVLGATDQLQSPCPSGAPLVAILVGGVVRGFDRERLRQAFMQHVVQPLAPDPAQRHLFVALKVISDPPPGASVYHRSRYITTDLDALRSGIASLHPRAWHLSFSAVDEAMLLRPPATARLAPGLRMGPRNTSCFLAQGRRVQGYQSTMLRALSLMEKEEQRPGRRKYEVVVFTRPDLLHSTPVPRWCDPFWAGVLAGTAVQTIGQDFAYFLPRAVAAEMAALIRHAMLTYQAKGIINGKKSSTCTMSATELLALTAVQRLRDSPGHAGHLRLVDTRAVGGCPVPAGFVRGRGRAPPSCTPHRLLDTLATGGTGPRPGYTLVSGLVRGFTARDPSCPERPSFGSG